MIEGAWAYLEVVFKEYIIQMNQIYKTIELQVDDFMKLVKDNTIRAISHY